jgi:hypothetical protein
MNNSRLVEKINEDAVGGPIASPVSSLMVLWNTYQENFLQ